jgi:hypothetical protein
MPRVSSRAEDDPGRSCCFRNAERSMPACSPCLLSLLLLFHYCYLFRSLGVHITFVRSIDMDSWTDKQLKHMKLGGNEKCNSYLQKNGIGPRTPIKQKYESDVAQLYKEILKARAEGLPEPTVLVKKPPRQASSGGMSGGGGGGGSGGMTGGGGGGGSGSGSTDANGMERMAGETEQQYIARQTRLREEARQRMASKFGGGGMMGGGGRMQGVGSDPSYNPNGGGGMDMGSLYSGLKSSITSVVDEQTVQGFKSTGASFWGSLTGGVQSVANSITAPGDGDFDGLADLQRQISSQKPSQSKYAGFGSDTNSGGGFNSDNLGVNRSGSNGSFASNASSGQMSSGGLQEAIGLAGEDRSGIERLSGESDDQYVMRQTRLREEARQRMAAKFGGGGMGSASSSGSAPARPTNTQSAPSSGNFGSAAKTSPPKKPINSNDFFSSFGS